MNKNLLFLLLLFAGMANAQIVTIPDAAFKAKLLASSATNTANNIAKNFSDEWMAVDANADGEIQLTEAQAVKYLAISGFPLIGLPITDVTGLSSFSNLETLLITNNNITSLNLSALANLKSVTASNMANLNSLNVNNLTNLTSLSCISLTGLTTLNVNSAVNLVTLNAMYCGFTTLNVNDLDSLTNLNCSGNQLTNLNGLSTSITKLDCSYNLLTNLDVSVLSNLTDLKCSGNLLTGLTAPISITKLNCDNNKLATLNLNGLTNLSELNCGGNKLTNLNVSGLTNLTSLSCTHNKLTNITISDLPNLITLYCSNNDDLASVTLSNLPNLQDFNVVGNMYTAVEAQSGLSSLSLSGLPNLKKLNCSYGRLTTLNLSGLSSLIEVNCFSNIITSLTLTNLPNLQKLNCGRNYITNLDASNLTNLVELGCADGYIENGQIIGRLTDLNVSGLVNLKKLNCQSNLLTTLDLTGLTNLEELNCDGMPNVRGNITSLNVSSLNNLKVLSCNYQKLTSLNVSNLVNLKNLSCASNSINSLNLTGLPNLETLNYSYNELASLNLINLPSLTELNCTNNYLVTLNVLNLTNLKTLNCSYNALTTLNLNGLANLISLDFSYNELLLTNVSGLSTNLKTLACASNSLTSLDVSGLTNLETLNCDTNELTAIDVSSLINLKNLSLGRNNISVIDVSNLTNLISLSVDFNQLTEIDITGLNNLIHFSCSNNLLSSLDLSNHEVLQSLEYSNNNLPNLDVSSLTGLGFLYCEDNLLTTLNLNNTNINHLRCYNNPLTTLFIKNGRNEEGLNLFPNPDLQFICADDSQIESIQTMLNGLDMNTTVCNSYCSFSPGGDYNTINGIAIFDANNDGCDITDEVNPFVKLSINSGSETGATVTNINGSYNFYTNTGNYTIAPDTENPSWFSFSPASATIPFLNNDNNVSTQNFCITAVGVHKDLEVVFAQLESARPGFDARYKLVFKNKGNQMQSGTVTLAFDEDRTDFLSATPAPANLSPNLLTWIFTNLMPFENRSIELTFNTNSPTETPAVNNGDILNFTASVTPITGDELPSDNQFDYNQTVVGSFDPNDIVCLEGATVSPDEIGNYLHYIVNFENTGTAAAEFVVVKLEINPSEFDVNSLQVMNASHPVLAEVKNNRVEFRFANINLQPTAGDPPVNGHGNVLFKMKSKTTLNTGDLVRNKANIFFDYNFPIETNDAETTFRTLSNPNFTADKSIVLYPNPAHDFINIKCDNAINRIELFDIQGRLLQTSVENKNTVNLNLSNQSNGVYFVRVTTDNGLKVEKIIKQ